MRSVAANSSAQRKQPIRSICFSFEPRRRVASNAAERLREVRGTLAAAPTSILLLADLNVSRRAAVLIRAPFSWSDPD
jgi:hypothetical protein